MAPDSKRTQIAVRPRKATPITRCPTLTGCRPEGSRTASGTSAGVCERSCVAQVLLEALAGVLVDLAAVAGTVVALVVAHRLVLTARAR